MFYWHIHHEELLEWSDNIQERIDYIHLFKPQEEIEIRLRLMQPVKGKLPQKIADARRALNDAKQAYDDASRAYYDVGQAQYDTWQAYWDMKRAYYDAKQAYRDATHAHRSEIEALHAKECPNCPWDGYTILPESK